MLDELAPGTYVEGAWIGLASTSRWLLADLSPDAWDLDRLWSVFRSDGDHRQTLDELSRHGLAAMPEFALVEWLGDRTLVVLRGSAVVKCVENGEEVKLEAGAASTWLERPLLGVVSGLTILGGSVGVGSGVLPLGSGVVRACALNLPLSTEAAGAAPRLLIAEASVPVTSASLADSVEPEGQTRGLDETLDFNAERCAASPATIPQSSPALDTPSAPDDYSDLFGMTVHRTVEDAAVRSDEPPDQATPTQPVGQAAIVEQPAPPRPHEAPMLDVGAPEGRPGSEPLISGPTPRSAGGLIDSVPLGAGRGSSSAPKSPGSQMEPAAHRTQQIAPVVAPQEWRGLGATQRPRESQEDLTIDRSRLDQLRREAEDLPAGGPSVHAIHCSVGHLNPAHASRCRVCGNPVPNQQPVTVPRPVLGILKMSSCDSVTLDRGVLMGRNPSEDRLVGGERPHVVQLGSASQDVSRNHLEVRLDGWHVLVADLNSTNGTLVSLPGQDAIRIKPGEPVAIEPGTTVTLADEVSFIFEATP